jgi:serine/threonine protein kinase
MNCQRCEHVVREGESFCGNCGAAIDSLETTLISPVANPESPPEADPLLGQILDSKYELLERLGQGGMGAVYKARRRHIGDEVAIKILLEKYLAGQEATERFRREARAAAMLRHPNIVAIHDFSDAAGTKDPAYIVMELVEGSSLRAQLKQEGKIDFERAVTLLRGVCAGVGLAHRKGIIHRDLKPDNIIIAPPHNPGDSETVKVIDFGIAKLREVDTGSSLTQTGFLVGTPFYMSPEQCLGEPLDQRSDVYSLGAILYEMLGGSPPFTGPTPVSVVAKHLSDMPVSLDRHGIAPELDQVCRRALAKNPDERYQSVDDFYQDLQRVTESVRSGVAGHNTLSLAAQAATTVTLLTADQATLVQGPEGSATQSVADAAHASGLDSRQTDLQQQAPATLSEKGIQAANSLRRIRRFAIAGGLIVLILSIGTGFLLRWLGWMSLNMAYDEFALTLMGIGLRDAIFGIFLGITLSALRPNRTGAQSPRGWVSSVIIYAAFGAAIGMLPFVVLRTSLLLIPLGLAITGAIVGLLVLGIKMLVHRFNKTSELSKTK